MNSLTKFAIRFALSVALVVLFSSGSILLFNIWYLIFGIPNMLLIILSWFYLSGILASIVITISDRLT